jgi:hypothetical protein
MIRNKALGRKKAIKEKKAIMFAKGTKKLGFQT